MNLPANLRNAYAWLETALTDTLVEARRDGVEAVAADCVANATEHGQCDFTELETEQAIRWALERASPPPPPPTSARGSDSAPCRTPETKARYSLVKTDGGDFYVQETDSDGALVCLCDADGETVVEANGSSRIGNTEWTLVRDLGPVTDDGFFDAVAACPELTPADESE